MLHLGRLQVNDPRKLFVDERTRGSCVYCGAEPTTRDHCPSKVLLDEPYPANLPVVDACERCNHSFSKDEQYVACMVECAICGSTEPSEVTRSNVRRILAEVPQLAEQIKSSLMVDLLGDKTWIPDMDRVRNVVLKLARGHIDYELSIQERGEPDVFEVVPLQLMDEEQRAFFEDPEPGPLALWPEIGSRAFLRVLPSGDDIEGGWIVVQEGRYRYKVGQGFGNYAHLVLSEYLACRVAWE